MATNSKLLDLAHTIHVLLIILGKARSWSIGATVDVICCIDVVDAIESVFLGGFGDVGRRGAELGLIIYFDSGIGDMLNGGHGDGGQLQIGGAERRCGRRGSQMFLYWGESK